MVLTAAQESWTTKLVHDHRTQLARVARREGLRADDAFDVVQDAFRTYLGLPDAERLVGDVEGSRKMLVAIARNLARNRRRRHALSRPHEDIGAGTVMPATSPTAEDLLVAAEDRVRLAGCLGQLVEIQRLVVS